MSRFDAMYPNCGSDCNQCGFQRVSYHAKIPRQREPAGVSGIAAGGGLQRLWGQKQNALSRPAPRQALADLAVGLVPAQQLVGHFAAVIAAHQHADQG